MSTTLSDIASLPGKGGLFRILSPSKSGVLLESLDEAKTRTIASASNKISLLSEISIFTLSAEGTAPLESVLKRIYSEFGTDPGVDANSDPAELKSFMKSVLPDYDAKRVYVSDIRKLVKWYLILVRDVPELLRSNEEQKA